MSTSRPNRSIQSASLSPMQNFLAWMLPVRSVVVFLCIALAAIGCSRATSVVVPHQETAKAQFVYAQKLEMRFHSPLQSKHREENSAEALAAYRKVMDDFPDDETFVNRSWLQTAIVYEKLNRTRKALRIYERLIRKVPDDPTVQAEAIYGAALIYDKLKKYEKALAYYDRIITNYKDSKDPAIQGVVKDAKRRYQKVRGE
jgi:tetratricopeptide (TPR) repeat protein